MISYKFIVELEEFIDKSAERLRAFRAAACLFLLLPAFSCSNEDLPPVCITGNCDAEMVFPIAIDENGYYHVDLSWDQQYYPYFTLDINASPIDPFYFYGDHPVAQANFDSNTTWIIGDTLVVQQNYYEPFTSPWNSNGPLPSYVGDLYLTQFAGMEINIAQGSPVYFSSANGRFTTKRTLGPFPPHMEGDTITVYMQVFWDAGDLSVVKSNFSEKFIVE